MKKKPERKRCGCGKYIRNAQDTSCAKCKNRLTRAMKSQLKKALGFKAVRGVNIAGMLMNNMIAQTVDAMVTPPTAPAAAQEAPKTRPPGIYKVPRNGDIPAGEIGVL